MQVRLITKTIGCAGTEYEGKTLDEIIVGIARLSSSRDTNTLFNEPHKLIRHCILNQHWSIFTMVNLTFEIITSRAIGRELLRHWSIRPQEYSQRYAEITEFEEIELRYECKTNRQSSTEIVENPELLSAVNQHLENSKDLYKLLLNSSVARETARMMLPETTQSRLIMNGSVREWVTTLNQRLHHTAQKEIRVVAQHIREVLIQECPLICKALYNFEYAEEIHILERLVLEKYKVFPQVKEKLQLK